MKKGTKVRYCTCKSFGKEIIRTAYVLRDDGDDCIWASDTKEDLNDGYGSVIYRSELR